MSDEIADIAAAIQKLKSGDSSARQAAIHQLIKIGRPAVDALIPLLKYHHEDVPWRVAYALGIICDARAVEALIEAMNDPSGSVGWKRTHMVIAAVSPRFRVDHRIGDTSASSAS